MKKLLTIIFLLSTMLLSTQEIITLKTFYSYDLMGNKIKTDLIEYDIYKGFRIDNGITEPLYFLAEKTIFNLTVKNDRINYLWFCWKNIAGEMLIITTPIFTLTSMDWQTGLITFIFNLNLYDNSTINNYYIEFYRSKLE